MVTTFLLLKASQTEWHLGHCYLPWPTTCVSAKCQYLPFKPAKSTWFYTNCWMAIPILNKLHHISVKWCWQIFLTCVSAHCFCAVFLEWWIRIFPPVSTFSLLAEFERLRTLSNNGNKTYNISDGETHGAYKKLSHMLCTEKFTRTLPPSTQFCNLYVIHYKSTRHIRFGAYKKGLMKWYWQCAKLVKEFIYM
jgi:hypothetical protein